MASMTSATSMIIEKPSPDTNLSDLNAVVFIEVADILDINRTWEKLFNVLPGSHYSAMDVHKFESNASARYSGSSPARSLLIDMGHKGFRVSHLVAFLEKLQLERALAFLKAFEPVMLSRSMQTIYRLQGGSNSALNVECPAIGFPLPTYQWFKLKKYGDRDEEWIELSKQCSRALIIKPVRLEDSGQYSCRFSNFDHCTNEHSYAFTDIITVFVEHEMFVSDKRGEVSLPLMRTPLEIIRHPSCPSRGPFYQGSTVVLECIAVGFEPITYEWLKNGRKIPGENSTTLSIIIQPEDDVVRFKYQCRVSNACDSVLSELVSIAVASPREGPQFLAEDKVALVIANDEYREHAGLRSAVTDVVTIAQQLSRLEFKVIAAINLDEEEMRNIVNEFCKLLDSGVYGVFYYAGHGFEVNKQCYMMPVDVARDYCCARCLCVEEVKGKMQNRNPALCCLMLDMCRKDPDCDSIDASRGYQVYHNKVDRNVICAYATSYSCPALDGPAGKNGLFVKHLRNYITKDWPIEVVLNHVFEDISVDPAASKRQFPSISEKTLAQTRRSLADRTHAMLPNCDERNKLYLSLIRKPSNFMIRCESGDTSVLHIHVTFDMEEQVVCNALTIKIHVTDENDQPQHAFTSCLGNLTPAYMRECLEQKLVEGENYVIVTLRNLQKLKEPLIIQGNVFHNRRVLSVWPETCLDFPLLSNVSRQWEVVRSHNGNNYFPSEEDDESGIESFTSQQHAG